MKFELEVEGMVPDFVAVEKGLDENGQLIYEPGEEIISFNWKPTMLKRSEAEELLKKLKLWTVTVEAK